jgi:hypothetical protein
MKELRIDSDGKMELEWEYCLYLAKRSGLRSLRYRVVKKRSLSIIKEALRNGVKKHGI